MKNPFFVTCVKEIDDYRNTEIYNDFGIHKMTASIYGREESDIIQIEMKISDDQSLPDKNRKKEIDYWGWLEKDGEMTMIYPSFAQFSVCFTYGYKAEEERGNGKAYRLEVIREVSENV